MRGLLLRSVVFLFVFTGSLAICFGQEAWKLKTEEDGIKVYTRSVADSKFKALRVECNLHTSARRLVAEIMDVKNCTSWVYHTKSITLLKQPSPSELYYYSEVNVPWPAQNRDFIAHLKVEQNPHTKVITVDAPCVNEFVKEKEDEVRIKHSIGKWVITPISNNEVHVDYSIEVDPGGSVPAWLVNMFATEGPLQSFKKLRQILKDSPDKGKQLTFIED